MKNKKTLTYLLFCYFVFFLNNVITEEIQIDSTEINILKNGDVIKGSDGFEINADNNIKITGENFEYDKKNSKLLATGNVVLIDKQSEIIIESENINYLKNEEKIFIKGRSKINFKNKFDISTENPIYLKNKGEIYSDYKTIIIDELKNKIVLNKFHLDKKTNIVSGKNVELNYNNSDTYFFENLKYNLNDKNLLGKDFYLVLNNPNPKENNYRIKGRTISDSNKKSFIQKGVFTTCKEADGCPPWLFQAKEVEHDKENKLIKYKNAWLKIYDIPVFYFPTFFHPDPTVERQSGFLMPTFYESANLGSSFTLPYFHAFSDSKDITFTPRIFKDKTLLQSEIREASKDSFHIADFSFFNHENNSKSHLFLNSKFNLNSEYFDRSSLELNLQNTNNDTYLSTYDVKSPIINSSKQLTSFLEYNAYKGNTSLNIYTKVYEDLTKSDDRYEYLYPYVNLSSSINNNLKYTATAYNKKFNTNQDVYNLTNNFIYTSDEKISPLGIKRDWNLLFKNVNVKRDKTSEKDGENIHFYSEFLYNFNLPLLKSGQTYDSIIDPKISLRYSPTDTRNMSDLERRLDTTNIFNLDRIVAEASDVETLEGGESLNLGIGYTLLENETLNEKLNIELAQVYRFEENHDLPKSNNIGAKASDLVGNIAFSAGDLLDLNYNFSLDSDLKGREYDSLDLEMTVNKFVTSFEYLDDQVGKDKNRTLKTDLKYNFTNNHSLLFSRRENKKINLTEYNNIIYEYKNDCLKAGIVYQKKNYTNNDLKPGEELMFTITLGSFGSVNSPNF